jgi:dUTP pyrophosphatase
MEIHQFKRTLLDFVKTIESAVEKKLGDRSQLEEQVRQFARGVEKTVSEAVWNRRSALDTTVIKVRRLEHFKGDLPRYETSLSSGFDIRAQLSSPMKINPGDRVMIPTGLSFEIPPGLEIQVRARSGLAIRSGIGVVNAPGTIDADYRGEVKVILINWGNEPVTIQDQDRIAQFVVCPVIQAELLDVEDLNETERGMGGFGSTGQN